MNYLPQVLPLRKYPPSLKPFTDDSVSARAGGFEGKFGEISGTNDVQPVTTGQFPHHYLMGGY